MEIQKLKGSLISVLTEMYSNEVFANLTGFCQGELRVMLWLSEDGPPEQNIPSAMAGALHVTRGCITAALKSLEKGICRDGALPERQAQGHSCADRGGMSLYEREKRAGGGFCGAYRRGKGRPAYRDTVTGRLKGARRPL